MPQGNRTLNPRPEPFQAFEYTVLVILAVGGTVLLMGPVSLFFSMLVAFGVVPEPPERVLWSTIGGCLALAAALAPFGGKCYQRRLMKRWKEKEESLERSRKDDIRRAARKLAKQDAKQNPHSSPTMALRECGLSLEDLDESDDELFVMTYRDALRDVTEEKIIADRELAEKKDRLARRAARLNEPRSEAERIEAEVIQANRSAEKRFDDLLTGGGSTS